MKRKLREIRLRYRLLRSRKRHSRLRALRIAIRITFKRKRILGQYP